MLQKYVGITKNHNHAVHAPGYVAKALKRFGLTNAKGANSPSVYNTSPVDAAAKTRIQKIVGVFLFYASTVWIWTNCV